MYENILDIPLVIIGPAIVVALTVFAFVGSALTRRFVLPRINGKYGENHRRVRLAQAFVVGYVIFACLVAISAFQTYSEASLVISREALQLRDLYEVAGQYPEPERGELQQALREYTQYIIQEAFPQMERGRIPQGESKYLGEIHTKINLLTPITDQQAVLKTEVLSRLDKLVDATRARLDTAEAGLPIVLWVVLVVGAILCIGSTFFVRPQNAKRFQTLVVLVLPILLGLVVFAVVAFDRPFRGDLRLGSTPYQIIHKEVMTR